MNLAVPASPGVTLLVPCYNAARFLPRLWESVRAQTTPFAEWIVYDDASTDDTVAVARSLGATVMEGKTNRGPAAARNHLAQAAQCDWFHFHDADDLLVADFLSVMSARLDGHADIVVCDTDWLDEQNRQLVMRWRYDEAIFVNDPIRAALRHPIGVNSVVFRRPRFLAVGGFDESLRMWEDADLQVRLAVSGARYAIVNRALSISLRRPDSLSHDYRTGWNCRLRALSRYANTLPAILHDEIAAQAETAAAALVQHHDLTAARAALVLARRFGANPPTTDSRVLRLLKLFLPTLTLLRLQNFQRQRSRR